MGKILTGMFLVTTVYLLVINQFENVSSTNGNSIAEAHRPQRPRIDSRILPRRIAQYTRMKPEKFIEFIDDDDLFDLSKRQASDDYGHLRFGKRPEEQFDDYGHMRFGRSGAD